MIFYKETNFKKEPSIGEIPTDWEIIKLGDESVSEIVMGQSPPSSTYNKKGIGLPFLQGKMEFGEIYPKALVYCSEPIKIAQPNDILISVRAPVGDVNLAPCKLCIGRGLAAIRFNDKLANYLFYFYYFQKIKTRLEMLGKGSTFKAIDKDDLESLMIPLPPVEEQRVIAGVLGVVDSVIAKTDEVIAKTERLKKGLMQTLLTRGIGHKEFKETEIGKIPKTWQVVRLADITIKIKDMDHRMPAKHPSGIPFVSIRYMLKYPDFGFTIRFDDPDLEFIRKEDFESQISRFNVEEQDILYSRFGSIGHAKLVITDQPFLASYSIVLVKPDKSKVLPEFLTCALNSERTRKQAKLQTKGATNRNLHLEDIQNLKIPLPPAAEQQKIAEIIVAIDRKLELEKTKKAKLERVKRGLMDLLLTGKVRVKVDCGAVCSC